MRESGDQSTEANSEPLTFCDVLRQEYTSLLLRADGAKPQKDTAAFRNDQHEKTLDDLYKLAHERKFSALCLSGGGVRSATFSLGVLQGLARLCLLDRVDYLSTVSGGGFIGSWLMAWVHRHREGAPGVFRELRRKPNELRRQPEDSPKSEPGLIQHLRSYSNYLTPKLGLLSGDTSALVAIYLRNLLMIWLILLPFLAAILMVPRLIAAALDWKSALASYVSLVLAFACGFLGIAYIGLNRPSASALLVRFPDRVLLHLIDFLRRRERSSLDTVCRFFESALKKEFWKRFEDQSWFFLFCLLPVVASALCLVLYLAWTPIAQQAPEMALWYGGFGFLLYASGWAVVIVGRWRLWPELRETVIVGVFGVFVGFLAWAVLQRLPLMDWLDLRFVTALGFPSPPVLGWLDRRFLAAFGVPILLALLLVATSIIVGLTPGWNKDADREWWARLGGWILVVALVWSVLSVLVIYGPLCLGPTQCFGDVPEQLIAGLGGLSGILATLIAWSSRTPPTEGSGREARWVDTVQKVALPAASVVFGIVVLVLLSWATSWLITSFSKLTGWEVISKLTGWNLVRDPSPQIHTATILGSSFWPLLLFFSVLVLVVWFASGRIDINKFSLHSMYRNRLIRAYLGASNENRDPNRFTGLDSYDNVDMHRLRRILLEYEDLKDWQGLRHELLSPSAATKELSDFIREQTLQDQDTELAKKWFTIEADPETVNRRDVVNALLDILNRRLQDSQLTTSPPTPPDKLPDEQKYDRKLILDNLTKMTETYKSIEVKLPRRPLHVINITLNLVGGKELAWQERKAQSFTVTPHHVGSWQLNDRRGAYRPSHAYGRQPNGPITLGTAVAISGAAASPNMGYHSSKTVAFLMTFFNARLGWWLGNPAEIGRKSYLEAGPKHSIAPLIREAFGLTHERSPYIYLSDGGHFENLGLYEMILRRCHYIIVVDASADAGHVLENLGNAIRKIRIDLGVPIELQGYAIYGRDGRIEEGRYCAVGKIRYSAVDKEGSDGRLIYIKPSIYFKQEPHDVLNYARASKTFPHEPTKDQWFSESQFESYRMLGQHMIETICGKDDLKKRLKRIKRCRQAEAPGNKEARRWEAFFTCVENYAMKRPDYRSLLKVITEPYFARSA